MSLLYACIYIVRFMMMMKAHKALEWAEVSVEVCLQTIYAHLSHVRQEAKCNGKVIYWNVWVLLALPAIWLSW
jgi:hypothetical protein